MLLAVVVLKSALLVLARPLCLLGVCARMSRSAADTHASFYTFENDSSDATTADGIIQTVFSPLRILDDILFEIRYVFLPETCSKITAYARARIHTTFAALSGMSFASTIGCWNMLDLSLCVCTILWHFSVYANRLELFYVH